MSELKMTPLHEEHIKAGAKMIEFGGWDMPVWYTSLIQEHNMVRESVGIFDVSHMGEIEVKGKEARKFVDYLITNNVEVINTGDIVYSPMCNENGGIVDDLLAYKFSEEYILLVVNASNTEKDFNWILKNSKDFDVEVKNLSSEYGQIAFQGPKAEELLMNITNAPLSEMGFYTFVEADVAGVKSIVSRTGYTGEDGFEIYLPAEYTPKVWQELMKLAKEVNGGPAGLGCRDTLRFEAVYMLYGNDINDETTPLEAGLKWAVDLNKEFIGKEPLLKMKEEGLPRRLKGIEILSKVPARHNYKIYSGDQEIGYVTSGSKSISTNRNLALGYLKKGFTKVGTEIEIEVRNKRVKAQVIKTPFYRGSVKSKKK